MQHLQYLLAPEMLLRDEGDVPSFDGKIYVDEVFRRQYQEFEN